MASSSAPRFVLVSGLLVSACAKIAGFDYVSGAPGTAGKESTDEGGAGLGPSGGTAFEGAGSGGALTGGTFGSVLRGGGSNETPAAGAPNGAPNGGTSGAPASASGGSDVPMGGKAPSQTGGAGGSAAGGNLGSMAGSAGALSEAGSGGEGGVIGGCDNQLLVNGDFEEDRRGWTEESNFGSEFRIIQPGSAPGLAEYGVTPQAGRYLGWLGGIPDNQELKKYRTTLKQTVTIPDEAASITLTGYIWIATEETEPEMDYLVAEIGEQVDDDNNLDVCWLAHWWWNGTTTSGWVPFTYTTNFACVRGTRVFRLESRQDPEVKTSFFVDSLRLVAACGR